MDRYVMEDKTFPDFSRLRSLRRDTGLINIRWAIQKNYIEMVDAGALMRYGRKILIDPNAFWNWLKEKGRRDA